MTSTWFYKAPKLIIGIQKVGPIDDIELVQLLDAGQIDGRTDVMSPEVTKGEWMALGRIKLSVIRERIEQRIAEVSRRLKQDERRKQADDNNRFRLKQSIRAAVESGNVSLKHREAFEKFAASAGIPLEVVSQTIEQESKSVLREVFEEALDDGILEPREEQQISQLAIALGVDMDFLRGEETRISLCRLAYELDSGTFAPRCDENVPFKMAAKETALANARVTWFEIVTLKRPAGIALGGDNYLKEVTKGMAYLTTKQVSVVGELQSKKITLTSVSRVTRYTDGILFNRSSGKSVFLGIPQDSANNACFGLIAEYACSGEPVLGHQPENGFIPPDPITPTSPTVFLHEPAETAGIPRYTFRVVGDHIGDRAHYISRMNIGDPLQLLREPDNPVDPFAVAVFDARGNMLGYLKRDVASWFGPIMDRKGGAEANVHTFSSGGSLIAGVFI